MFRFIDGVIYDPKERERESIYDFARMELFFFVTNFFTYYDSVDDTFNARNKKKFHKSILDRLECDEK